MFFFVSAALRVKYLTPCHVAGGPLLCNQPSIINKCVTDQEQIWEAANGSNKQESGPIILKNHAINNAIYALLWGGVGGKEHS